MKESPYNLRKEGAYVLIVNRRLEFISYHSQTSLWHYL
jgi:hypothetical protein